MAEPGLNPFRSPLPSGLDAGWDVSRMNLGGDTPPPIEPSAGGGEARRPMIERNQTPAGVNAFAEVGRGLNLAREKLAQQMNRKVLGVVVGDVAIGAAGGAATKIALDMVFGIAGGPLGGAAAGAIKGSIGEWLKQSKEIAASGDRLSFKENLKRHNGGRIVVAATRGAIIGAVGGALGEYAIEQISQTEWGQQAGKFIADRTGEFARTISKQPFFKVAPSSAPGLLEPGQIPSPPAIPDAIEPLSAAPAPTEPPPPEPPAPTVPVEIPPAAPPIAPAPEVVTPLPPSPTAPGEVLLPPQPPTPDLTQPEIPEVAEPAVAEPPAAVPAPDIQTDQVADQVEPLPPTVAPNGAQIQGSVVDNSLTYNGQPWVLLDNGARNIGSLFQMVGETGTIDQEALAANLQEATKLWVQGELKPSTQPDLWRVFHLSNGTSSVYNGLLDSNTLDSLKNLGIVGK